VFLLNPSTAAGADFHINAQMLAKLLLHLKHRRDFLFGKHTDLKIEMGAALGLASHSVLADEHEDSEENTL
jgi:hypothetical protein